MSSQHSVPACANIQAVENGFGMSQQSITDLLSGSQGLNSQEAFQSIWSVLSNVTENGEYTQLNAIDPQYEYASDEQNTEVVINKLFVPAQFGHQDTITDLFGVIPDGHPASPGSQAGSCTPIYQNGVATSPMQMSVAPVPTLPSNTNYPGPYKFEMTLGTPPKETKSTTWTYSQSLEKLFARMAVSCPFKFKCASPPPAQCKIRAMAIYAKPEHVTDIVRRCPNHTQSQEFRKDGVPESHFVRCDNPSVEYCDDPESSRQSVLVPLESNEVGDEWRTYLYQFMCNNSCAGGINRRAVQVVFTLESYCGEVLGRQVIEVRICACPGRDRKDSERTTLPSKATKKREANKVTVTNEFMSVGPAAKKPRTEEEVFTLTVRGRENYEMLVKIRDSLELASAIPTAQLQEMRNRQASIHKQASMQRLASIPTPSQAHLLVQQYPPSQPLPSSQPQAIQVPRLSQGFNFTSLSQEAYKLPSIPTQPTFRYPGVEETDGGTPNTNTSPDSAVKAEPEVSSCEENSLDVWLKKVGLSAYIDFFHTAGYTQMYQLDKDKFTMEDLNKMKIGSGHRNKLWKALLEYREEASTSSKLSQDFLASSSRASTLSLHSQGSGISPCFFEVTKYTFRQTVNRKPDHDYCKDM